MIKMLKIYEKQGLVLLKKEIFNQLIKFEQVIKMYNATTSD